MFTVIQQVYGSDAGRLTLLITLQATLALQLFLTKKKYNTCILVDAL